MSRELLNDWNRQAYRRSVAQMKAAKLMHRCNLGVNISIIFLSATISLVGTSGFQTSLSTGASPQIVNNVTISVHSSVHPSMLLPTMTVISWVVSCLTAINHFFNFASKKQKHLSCSRQYENLQRDIETVLSLVGINQPSPDQVRELQQSYNQLDLNTPTMPSCLC